MTFTPWLNHIKESYQATNGLDWDRELVGLRKLAAKHKDEEFQKGVAELFSRMATNADDAYKNSNDVSAWNSLEKLLEHVAVGMNNQQLKKQLNEIRFMQDGENKHNALKQLLNRQEIMHYLTEKMEEFLRNEKNISKEARIKQLIKARHSELSKQCGLARDQASYSPEGRFVINALELFYMFLEILAEKLDLSSKPAVVEEEEEAHDKEKIRFLPQAAPPPRPAAR